MTHNPKTFTILTWCIVCIGIVAAVAILVSKRGKDADITIDEETASTSAVTRSDVVLDPRVPYRTPISHDVSLSVDTVAVRDQAVGDRVHLDEVILTASGWVAIHETNPDDSLGAILGAARFDTGVWQGEVLLLRDTQKGKRYQAVIYHDDGDKEFDFKKDVIVMRDGAPVMTSFITF